MRLEGVEVLAVRLALREPVASTGLVHTDKTTLFVRVRAGGHSGWGECAAYPGARAPDPTVAAVQIPVEHAVRRLFDASPDGQLPDPEAINVACGGGSVVEQTAAAALEMAVFDLSLVATGRPLAEAVGAVRERVEYGAVVGIPSGRDPGELTDRIAAALEAGVRRIRIKIEPGWERVPLAAARARFPEALLFADANGSFDPGDSALLRSLDDYSLRCLEQPFGPADIESHGVLASAMDTPIGLDESLWSVDRVRQAVEAGACRVACLKPGRLGGLFPAMDAASACATAGVDCFVGGFFETGLGRAANTALAGRPEFGLPGDIGPPDRYLDAAPFTSLPAFDGTIALSAEPGIGAVARDGVLFETRARAAVDPLVGRGFAGECQAEVRAYNRASMQRFFVERRIRDVHERLVRARKELAVLDEQYAVVADAADDARLRSLVSETPLAAHEYGEVRRHADAMARARDALITTVSELEHRRDELLQYVGAKRR